MSCTGNMLSLPKRIYITGASGSGVTTLGQALAARFNCVHYDIEDFHWVPTNPPFQQRRPPQECLELISACVTRAQTWILSGYLDNWGDALIPLFDLVVFLYVSPDVRIARLRAREERRFGSKALEPGGSLHERHTAFIEWTAHYDHGTKPGRSLSKHNSWLAKLHCPVIRIDGEHGVEQLVMRVLSTYEASNCNRPKTY